MKKGGFLLLVLFIACLSGCIWLCSGAFSEERAVTPGLQRAITTGQVGQKAANGDGKAEKAVKTAPSLAATKPVLNSGGM
ncbi:MAG TPA: hypothetical protein VHY08_25775 [Bacillota bacterium]|nr:hypothetical protein [Bacillota bacterium]